MKAMFTTQGEKGRRSGRFISKKNPSSSSERKKGGSGR